MQFNCTWILASFELWLCKCRHDDMGSKLAHLVYNMASLGMGQHHKYANHPIWPLRQNMNTREMLYHQRPLQHYIDHQSLVGSNIPVGRQWI